MSYDFAVWEGVEPASAEAAEEQFSALADRFYEEESRSPPSAALQRFAKALLKVFPDGDADSPWAFAPLLENASGPVWIIPCQPHRAGEAARFLGSLAREHGLHCVDLQSNAWLSNTEVPSARLPRPVRFDSREESKLLRKALRELLRGHGFERDAPRRFWRDWEEGVDVVEFWPHAPTVTWPKRMEAWVSVSPGVVPAWIPARWPVSQKNGRACPDIAACPVRFVLWKREPQQESRDRPDVWFLHDDRSDVRQVIADICRSLEDEGLPWLEAMHDPKRMLALLLDLDERWEPWQGSRAKYQRGTAEMGRRPSPNRNALTGSTAARVGDTTLAREKLTAFVEWRDGRPEEDRVEFRNGWDEAAEAILADLR